MNFKKCLFFFGLSFLFFNSCLSFKFGGNDFFTINEKEDNNSVREFDLSYTYKVMGINVSGKKSIIEKIYTHTDGKTIFVFISFPKIGILKSTDYGKSFKNSFFTQKNLDTYFGYIEGEDDSDISKKRLQEKYNSLFAVSPTNSEKIVISMGSTLFISSDLGEKWDVKNIFYDDQKSNIVDLFITRDDTIVAISENKVASSKNFGKNWKVNYIKMPKVSFFNTRYICGVYDNSTDSLIASIRDQSERDYELSLKTYDFFYNSKNKLSESGVYTTSDYGKTWHKSDLNIPLALWRYNDGIYGSSLYPLSFYLKDLTGDIKKSSIIKSGKLDDSSTGKRDFFEIMRSFTPDDYQIISKKNNKLVKMSAINNTKVDSQINYQIIEESDFANIYTGLKRIENIGYIHRIVNDKKKSNNIFYEYNPYTFYKLWNGFKINSPILYERHNDTYYRIRPSEKYLDSFLNYSLTNQIKYNSINPFMKKSTDVEFFDANLDPTNGMPIIVESSKDNGESWTTLYDSKFLKNTIDPLNSKRNYFYWLKNIDEKKNFKLKISFGFGENPNMLIYPIDIKIVNNEILVIFSYFSIDKNYQDGYLLPIN